MASPDVEVFKAKTEQILLAYTKAYGNKLKGKNGKEKTDKKAVQEFISQSSANERMMTFKKFLKTTIPTSDLNAELTLLKDRLVIASSFSVLEQQILRTLSLRVRKQAAGVFMNSEDPRLKSMVKETQEAFRRSMTDLSNLGYGIPFDDEMLTEEEIQADATESREVIGKSEAIIKEILAPEFANLTTISENIKVYNQYSLAVRKEFRNKLDAYIQQVLKNLSREDFTREILKQAAQGSTESLLKVRDLLGKDLVTEKEILDVKLRKLIQDIIH